MKKNISLFLLFSLLLTGGSLYQLEAGWLKDLNRTIKKNLPKAIKVVAVGALIKQLARPLNNFINTILANKGAANRAHTKVVPLLTLDRGIAIGAAQVQGSPEDVSRVKSVIAVEQRFSIDKRFHIKAYIPNRHTTPVPLSRVNGVGVSAIIDYKI